MVSSICWYAIINNLTVQVFEVVLAFVGPVSEIFCHIEAGLSDLNKLCERLQVQAILVVSWGGKVKLCYVSMHIFDVTPNVVSNIKIHNMCSILIQNLIIFVVFTTQTKIHNFQLQ